MADDILVNCHNGTIRLLADQLVLRRDSGELLRRCRPEESFNTLFLAHQLVGCKLHERLCGVPNSDIRVEVVPATWRQRRVTLILPPGDSQKQLGLTTGELDELYTAMLCRIDNDTILERSTHAIAAVIDELIGRRLPSASKRYGTNRGQNG